MLVEARGRVPKFIKFFSTLLEWMRWSNMYKCQMIKSGPTVSVFQILNGVPDQDTFYDITDYLEGQGMEAIIQRHVAKNGTDLDLIAQMQLYEAALGAEDGVVSAPQELR